MNQYHKDGTKTLGGLGKKYISRKSSSSPLNASEDSHGHTKINSNCRSTLYDSQKSKFDV
jgi:hypothetical protein